MRITSEGPVTILLDEGNISLREIINELPDNIPFCLEYQCDDFEVLKKELLKLKTAL